MRFSLLFNQAFPNSSALGAERHNDIGYPTVMLCLDSNTEDVVSDNNGYNWTGYDLTFEDRENTSLEGQMVWNDLYSIVFAANNVVGSIDEKKQKTPMNNSIWDRDWLHVHSLIG